MVSSFVAQKAALQEWVWIIQTRGSTFIVSLPTYQASRKPFKPQKTRIPMHYGISTDCQPDSRARSKFCIPQHKATNLSYPHPSHCTKNFAFIHTRD